MRVPYRSPLVGLLALAVCLSGGLLIAQQHAFVTGAEAATGTVQTASVESYERVSTRPSLFGDTEYRANVTYAYVVDGVRYESDRIFPGPRVSVGDGRGTATVANRFEAGESVTVRYDSSNPGRSFLVPRYSFVPGFALVVAGILFGAEFLTPETALLAFVFDRFSRSERKRARGSDGANAENEWNDPERIRESADATATGDGAVTAGWRATAVWGVAGACAFAVVAAYLLVSAEPHSPVAFVAAVVGVAVPAVRVGAARALG